MEHGENPCRPLKKTANWETDTPVGIQILWYNVVETGNGIMSNDHSHPFYEVHFVLSGEVCYTCGKEAMTARANEALLIPPNAPHRFCRRDKSFNMAYLAFQLKPDGEAAMPFPKEVTVFPFSRDIVQNIRQIEKIARTGDIFTRSFVGNRLVEIVHDVYTDLGGALPPMALTEDDSRLAAAKRYIDQNKHCRISCEDVASACGISRKQLNRIFKKHTGKTLNDYLLEVQLMYAERLVLQGEYTVKQIGYLLGFQNESGFGAYFKRYFGLSPKRYREQYKTSKTTYLL